VGLIGDATTTRARLGHGPCHLLVGRDASSSPASGTAIETEDLDGHRRTGFFHLVAAVVEHGPDLAPATAGHDRVTDPERAPLDEHRRDRTRPWSRLEFQHERPRRDVGVRAERWVVEVGDQQDRLEQLVDTDTGGRRDLVDDGVATPVSGSALLHELLLDAVDVGVVAIDLGDRDDDRDVGVARVVDRLDRLGHHAVVGCDDEHRDVRWRRRRACAWR